jgi:glycosyltransferase involved in cell wall biosynthesis
MKILIYSEYFLPVVGGVQTSIELLARGLVDFAPEEGKLPSGVGKIEVTVVTRTPQGGMDDAALSYRVIRRPGFSQLVHLIRGSDVIHLAGPCLLPMAIAWLIGKPVVIEHHAYQSICPNGLLFKQPSQVVCPGHFAKKQYGECVRCCSQTIGLLGSIRSVLLTFPRHWLSRRVAANVMITDHVGKRLNLPRTSTVYYGIPETPALPVGVGNAASPPNTFEIAYVGRLVAEKGLPVLLNAAKCLKEKGTAFKLTFIGGGPEKDRLEQLAETLGFSGLTVFTGDLRGPALEQAVNKVAVVVMPSIWEETAGLSAIEQMMRGRVVVAADIGGLGEVVGDAGLKFPMGDAPSLCACLERVVDEPALAERLGKMARERAVTKFSWERMVQAYRRLYADVLQYGDQSKSGRD